MCQFRLFSEEVNPTVTASGARPLDPHSAQLIADFRSARLGQGAHPQSVRREVSQLRSIVREAGAVDHAITLRTLFADLDLVARVLREPQVPIARSTGRTRLLAVQRFVTLMAQVLGRDPATDLAALDARLPARRAIGWHVTGTVVAGAAGRRRRRGPTLDAADLYRVVEAAGTGGGAHGLRDRVLVALHCFSGLRPEEIVRLRWEDLSTELTAHGRYGLTATVERGARRVQMLLPGPAIDAVEALAHSAEGTVETLSGPIFCANGLRDHPLSYRAARDVLRTACRLAGLPSVDAATLRSACAHWLRSQGLSDHEVASILGLSRVRSVDRLLAHHLALDAQRAVQEVMRR